jgi:signal peptidase II
MGGEEAGAREGAGAAARRASVAAACARAAAVLAAVVAADQLTKAIVIDQIPRGERRAVFPGIHLVHVRNRGIAFGLLDGRSALLTALTLGALALLVVYFALHTARPLLWLPTGLLLGGALGNLIDRLRHGAVTDFIDLPLWPAFNVADAAITVGVVALVLSLEMGRGRARGGV